jgi:hypothetical protein
MSGRPEHDPVERLAAARRRVNHVGVVCCASVFVWAVWPWTFRHTDHLATSAERQRSAAQGGTSPATTRAGIDPSVFDVSLWTPPPMPPVPRSDVAVVSPPPPPLKLQLLGISGDGSGKAPFRAALYDPDTVRVILVSHGEMLSRYTVRALTGEAVEFVDGARVERLTLREPSTGWVVTSGVAR